MKDLYVDGQWRAPRDGASRDIIDPLDQRVVRTVAEAGVADVHDAIAAARRAFDESDWPRLPGARRGRLLGRLADAIEADREHLAALETDDTGKTLVESRMDMDDIAGVVRYYAGLADKDVLARGGLPRGPGSRVRATGPHDTGAGQERSRRKTVIRRWSLSGPVTRHS